MESGSSDLLEAETLRVFDRLDILIISTVEVQHRDRRMMTSERFFPLRCPFHRHHTCFLLDRVIAKLRRWWTTIRRKRKALVGHLLARRRARRSTARSYGSA